MPAPTTGQKERWRCISDRHVCVGLACSPGKGGKLSRCRCLCGLHFSLVFKPHIVPDLLPIAESELIMQLLLIKQRCYIFISIRLLIPPYLKKKKKKGSASPGRWRKVSVGMVLEMHFTSVGRTCSPHVSSLGDSGTELALGSLSTSPSAFLLPGSAELKGGIPKAVVGSPERSHRGETGAVRDGGALNSGGWVGRNGSVLFSILCRKFHILCRLKSKVWKIWV